MYVIAEAFEELFAREDWRYTKRDERTFSFGFRGDNNRYDFWAFINEKGNILSIYSIIPMAANQKRLEIADFLHRANYDMMIGNFELDMRDGEIRFKTSADFNGEKPDLEMINKMIDCCLAMADRYLPGVGAILFSDITPEQAIEMVEGGGGTREERSTIVQ